MGERSPKPLCRSQLGSAWIDAGTNCRTRSPAPGPTGRDSAQAIDSLKASLEKAFVSLDRHMPNQFLISAAGDIVNKLLGGEVRGQLEQSAAAKRFLKMRDVFQDRLLKAPRDKQFLPVLEGVTWKANDPLAGIVEGVSPFHMADWISLFITDNRAVRRPKVRKPKAPPAGEKAAAPKPATPSPAEDPWAKTKAPSSDGIADGLKEPKDSGVPGAIKDITIEELLSALEADMLGLAKTAYDNLTQWVDALREGVQISTRRFAIKFLPHIIANTAAGIKGEPRVIKATVGGGTFKVKGSYVDWSTMKIPAPSLRADIKKMIWDADIWHSPSDSIAFAEAEKMAVARAEKFFANLNKKQNGARYYLRRLKKEYNGNYLEILDHVASELRKRL